MKYRRSDFEGVGVYHYVDAWGRPIAELGGALGGSLEDAYAYLKQFLAATAENLFKGRHCKNIVGCKQIVLLHQAGPWQAEAKRSYAKMSQSEKDALIDFIGTLAQTEGQLDAVSAKKVQDMVLGKPVPAPVPVVSTHRKRPAPSKACPPGWLPRADGGCAPPSTSVINCPPGMIGTHPNCSYPVCPTGQMWNGSECVSEPMWAEQAPPDQGLPGLPCPPTMVGTAPDCKCPEGTIWSMSTFKCEPVQQLPPPEPPSPVVAAKPPEKDYTPWIVAGGLGLAALVAGGVIYARKRAA